MYALHRGPATVWTRIAKYRGLYAPPAVGLRGGLVGVSGVMVVSIVPLRCLQVPRFRRQSLVRGHRHSRLSLHGKSRDAQRIWHGVHFQFLVA